MSGTGSRLARGAAALALVGGLAAGTTAGGLAAQEIKLGHLAPTNDPRHEVLQEFAAAIEEATGGEFQVEVFPDSTLGGERELFEQLQAGVTELALVGGVVSNFYPQWSILDMPFLWEDQDHVLRFTGSDMAQQWAEDMSEQLGVEFLAFFPRNPRILVTNTKPVESIEDLAGMKVRVPEINTFMDTWREFGVQPVPLPASEFYMGLRLGMIDGMENPVEVMYHWKIYEVGDYLSLTEHVHGGFFLLASSRFWEELDEASRQAIRDAAAEAAQAMRDKNAEGAATLYDQLEAEGMEIVEPDVSGFKEASQRVHEKYMDVFGREAYDRALELAQE